MSHSEKVLDVDIVVQTEPAADITVNGQSITEQAIAAEMQYHPAASREEAYQLAARALVVRLLLLHKADQLGITAVDAEPTEVAVESAISELIEQEVQVPEPDEVSCRHYFDNNQHKFRTQDLIEASHILLPAAPDDLKERRRMRELADDILTKLNQGASFEDQASHYSVCPSKKEGGHLGQLSPGQTVEEFERQVFALVETGIAKKPIESRYGFHVVRIDQRVEGQLMAFSEAKGRIADYLQERVKRKAISQFIEFIAGEAEIKGFDLNVSDSPLLQ
ncbi:MAG: peptidylprolyl isomerase [Pseudomonadota bacterium]|nr:peptidylprolyl isomerase [Pseudomonadota bacterium]